MALELFGIPLSLYAFVGMIMMIDFALHRERQENVKLDEAIFEAALLGTLLVAIGFGTGSEARRPLGLALAGRRTRKAISHARRPPPTPAGQQRRAAVGRASLAWLG